MNDVEESILCDNREKALSPDQLVQGIRMFKSNCKYRIYVPI